MSEPIPQDYGRLLDEVKERIRSARREALRAVDEEGEAPDCGPPHPSF